MRARHFGRRVRSTRFGFPRVLLRRREAGRSDRWVKSNPLMLHPESCLRAVQNRLNSVADTISIPPPHRKCGPPPITSSGPVVRKWRSLTNVTFFFVKSTDYRAAMSLPAGVRCMPSANTLLPTSMTSDSDCSSR